MTPHTIFFIGKPGCGKGTQAKLLSEATGWPVIGTSDGLREIAKGDTAVGHKLLATMNAGELVPSYFPMYVFLKAVFALKEDSSVIFDGFNRKVQEAELIIDSLRWIGRPFSVFHLHVPDEEVHTRIEKRKKIEGRADDDRVHKRLEEYYANTEATLDVFRKARVLVEVHGVGKPEDIAAEIRTDLKI